MFDPKSEIIYVGENHPTVLGLGDAVALTAVVKGVHAKYPDKKIVVKTPGSKEPFLNNPYIDHVEDGCVDFDPNVGTGHYTARKLRYFDCPTDDIMPDMYFTPEEVDYGRKTHALLIKERPMVTIAINSSKPERDWQMDNWIQIVNFLNQKFDVYQIDQAIFKDRYSGEPRFANTLSNARQELRNYPIRQLMCLMGINAGGHIGTNTAFLPIASSCSVNNFFFMHNKIDGGEEFKYPNNNFDEGCSVDMVKNALNDKWQMGLARDEFREFLDSYTGGS